MTGKALHAREAVASAAQYALLGGFTAVAAGISAQGLTGFARDNMGLRGAWPYLLFLALDGAAGVCAVLLTRRAARAESGLAPRLAVWGLVAASATFNFTHAPHRPAGPEAFGVMPVIAAVLFEFTLRELRLRKAGRADRKLTPLRWLHPAERIHVQLRLAADDRISAETATRRVRADHAARRLYLLRRALHAQGQAASPGAMTARRIHLAERRAHAALTRAGFADPVIAAEVLRQVQVLTLTPELARLNYATAEAAQAAIANLISPRPPAVPPPGPDVMPVAPVTPGGPDRSAASWSGPLAAGSSGQATPRQITRAGQPGAVLPALAPGPGAADGTRQPANTPKAAAGQDGNCDGHLVAAAARILTEATRHGERLSQAALGGKLRSQGHHVANRRLQWLLAAASDLAADDRAAGSQLPAPQAPRGTAGPPPLRQPAAPVTADHPVNGSQARLTSPSLARQPGQDGARLPGGQ
jgi:hypothetical protein